MKITESNVVNAVENYLEKKGYKIKVKKGISSHGADIKTDYHPIYRKQFIIEAKGEAGQKKSSSHPIKHNAFYYMLGQILSRMDSEGNRPNKGRIYALA